MDYPALNQQLAKLLAKFDLNQTMGGCSLAIFHQGQQVTVLAHGVANIDRHTQQLSDWQPDTLALNFSTGKGVLMTLIHVLVSQQLLDYDRPITDDWAEFAQNGKANITLRHILTHQSGLFDIVSITHHAKDMLDWQLMLQQVEQMAITSSNNAHVNDDEQQKNTPQPAYSALVSGWILGGLIEKVTKLPLQQAFEQFLLEPLGLVGQVYFGVPTDKVEVVAGLMRAKEQHSKPVLAEDSQQTLDFYHSLPCYPCWRQQSTSTSPLNTQTINALYFDSSKLNMDDYKSALVPIGSRQFNYYHSASLQAKIPAANGVATSVALATIYAMLANQGNWHGKPIITPAVYQQLSTIYNHTFDKVMPAVMAWRLGYHRVFSVCHPVSHAFGHMGYNGSMAWCDPSRQLAVAFVHNYDVTMLNDNRQFIINEIVLDFFR